MCKICKKKVRLFLQAWGHVALQKNSKCFFAFFKYKGTREICSKNFHAYFTGKASPDTLNRKWQQ